ncbi:MAG: PD-(D/E)XK nuclease family protein [Candidatus Helarchaeota archaeon]
MKESIQQLQVELKKLHYFNIFNFFLEIILYKKENKNKFHETGYSRILSWLLNPDGNHNLGFSFLNFIFEKLDYEFDFEKLKSLKVLTEVLVCSNKNDKIDIEISFIYQDTYYHILIENKIESTEENKLIEYIVNRSEEVKNIDNIEISGILIGFEDKRKNNIEKFKEENSYPVIFISWEEIVKELRKLSENTPLNFKYFISDFIDHVKTRLINRKDFLEQYEKLLFELLKIIILDIFKNYKLSIEIRMLTATHWIAFTPESWYRNSWYKNILTFQFIDSDLKGKINFELYCNTDNEEFYKKKKFIIEKLQKKYSEIKNNFKIDNKNTFYRELFILAPFKREYEFSLEFLKKRFNLIVDIINEFAPIWNSLT